MADKMTDMKDHVDESKSTKKINNGRSNSSRKSGSHGKGKGSRGGNQSPRSGSSNRDRAASNSNGDNSKPYDNDPAYYSRDKALLDQTSQFSFNQFIGETTVIADGSSFDVPAISVLQVIPTPNATHRVASTSVSVPQPSGINMMAKKLYIKLSQKTGRTSSYTPASIGLSILAVGELLSMYSYLRRFFGIPMTFSGRNRALPSALIEAMGVDSQDFYANMSVYRVRFNSILNIANQIPMLDGITYFTKCVEMYDDVFADGPTTMSQLYVMVPAYTWEYNENTTPDGSYLSSINVYDAENPRTFAELLNTFERMVNKLLTSTLLNVVYSDILNYVSNNGGKLYIFPLLMEGYQVTPQYNELFLWQLHNAVLLGELTAKANMTNKQYTNMNDVEVVSNGANAGLDIKYAPAFSICKNFESATYGSTIIDKIWYTLEKAIADFPMNDPDVKSRVDFTRFTAGVFNVRSESVSGKYNLIGQFRTGDHSILKISIFKVKNLRAEYIRETPRICDSADLVNTPEKAGLISKFDYWPVTVMNSIPDTTHFNVTGTIGDLNYFTILSEQWLANVNTIFEQGLFDFG